MKVDHTPCGYTSFAHSSVHIQATSFSVSESSQPPLVGRAQLDPLSLMGYEHVHPLGRSHLRPDDRRESHLIILIMTVCQSSSLKSAHPPRDLSGPWCMPPKLPNMSAQYCKRGRYKCKARFTNQNNNKIT